MELHVQNLQDKIVVTKKLLGLLKKVAMHVLQSERCPANSELGIILVDDNKIRELNTCYRGREETTDVLSFAFLESANEGPIVEEATGEVLLGDVVISVETAQRQARQYGHSLEKEISFLTIHGILHILGYDDEEEEKQKRMCKKEKELLVELEKGNL